MVYASFKWKTSGVVSPDPKALFKSIEIHAPSLTPVRQLRMNYTLNLPPPNPFLIMPAYTNDLLLQASYRIPRENTDTIRLDGSDMAAIPNTSDKNSMIPPENVVIGIPKKGRLYDRCMKLLAGAGLDHRRVRKIPRHTFLYLYYMNSFLKTEGRVGKWVGEVEPGRNPSWMFVPGVFLTWGPFYLFADVCVNRFLVSCLLFAVNAWRALKELDVKRRHGMVGFQTSVFFCYYHENNEDMVSQWRPIFSSKKKSGFFKPWRRHFWHGFFFAIFACALDPEKGSFFL